MSDSMPGLDAGWEALGRFLADADDLATMLTTIAHQATKAVPGCDLASVSMVREGTTVFGDPRALALDDTQHRLSEGPGVAVMRHGGTERVEVATESRWPGFIAVAKERKVVGVLSFALRSDAASGGLNLYSMTSVFTDEAMETARIFGDQLAVAAINAAAYVDGFKLTQHRRRSLQARAVIEQAREIILAQSEGRDTGYEAGRPLDLVRRELMLTYDDLWLAYFGLGGAARPDHLFAYLHGSATLTRAEHNIVVQALNEEFVDLGDDPPVPYLEPPS